MIILDILEQAQLYSLPHLINQGLDLSTKAAITDKEDLLLFEGNLLLDIALEIEQEELPINHKQVAEVVEVGQDLLINLVNLELPINH